MENFYKDKISVYGGTGFIGTRFCEKYPGYIVKIPRESNVPKSRNILYLISTVHNYNVFDDLKLDINTNLIKLMDVLKHYRHDTVFNFVSSWFVYGKTDLPAHENSICHPAGFYSITKKCAEDMLVSFCKTFNVKYRILRLCNVYGPNPGIVSSKRNALQFLIEKLRRDEEISLYYEGKFTRDYMHVDDVCDAIFSVIDNVSTENQIINICSGNKYVFGDLIEYCKNLLGSKSNIVYLIGGSVFHDVVQVKDMHMDNSKLRSIGFKEHIDIWNGLKQICEQY